MMGNMAEHERLSRRLASAGVSEPFEQTARARFFSTEPTMLQTAMHQPAMYRPAMYPARCRTAGVQAGGAGVLGRIGAAATSHPLEAFDHMTLATLGLACMWHDEDGKQARARLWKACDAPSSTGRISAADLDRWVRAALAVAARGEARAEDPAELAFWQGLLLARTGEVDPQIGWEGGAGALWTEAAKHFERAERLGHPDGAAAAAQARRVRDAR